MAVDLNLVRNKVQQYLVSEVGQVNIDADGDFSFQMESARVFVRVAEHPNGQASVVSCFSQVLHDVPPSPEFFQYVATNDGWIFGALTASEQPDGNYMLVMRQSLLGDTLDKDELLYVAFGVVSAADDMDEELAAKFGGRVFHE